MAGSARCTGRGLKWIEELAAFEASFWELSPDVKRLQELTVDPQLGTGLSSAAAEELLQRVHPAEKRQEVALEERTATALACVELQELARCGLQLGEDTLHAAIASNLQSQRRRSTFARSRVFTTESGCCLQLGGGP